MKKHSFKPYYTVLVVLLAAVVALAIASAILALLGANVLETFKIICIQPFSSAKNFTGLINKMTPLAIVGVGICIAYRSGFINLGGEGQMTMGILLSLVFGLNASDWPRWALLGGMILCGMVGGAIWGWVAGILKTKFSVSELLSTVMLNYVASQLFTYCIRVPLIDPAASEPQTVQLSKNAWLSKINELIPGLDKATKFHSGIIVAVVLALIVYFIMWKTGTGYKMRAAGLSERAARYGGIHVKRYALLSVVLSGACCGLAGTVEILGIHHRGLAGVTGGYGFSGIVVALFGGLHPVGVLPASFFFAVITYGCTLLKTKIAVLSNITNVLQGLVILVIVAAQMLMTNKYMMDKTERFFTTLFIRKQGGLKE